MRIWTVGLGVWLSIAACDESASGVGSRERTIRGDGARDDGTDLGGSPGGGSGGEFDGKVASRLTATETAQFCAWLVELTDTPFTDEEYCTQAASEASDDPDECEDLRDACVENFDQGRVAEPECRDAEFADRCTVTVGEFKRCLRDLLESASEAIERATCADPERGRTSASPGSCNDIPDECFDFADTF